MTVQAGEGATPPVADANAQVRMRLPFADTEDFEDARRGRVGSLSDPVIRATSGRVVWDVGAYSFLDAGCPDSVNPSLWRQAQLNSIHGLFEVTEGIYQVRGLDLSNMTIVEGDDGRARDRSAHLDRMRGHGTGAVPPASRRSPGDGAAVHA